MRVIWWLSIALLTGCAQTVEPPRALDGDTSATQEESAVRVMGRIKGYNNDDPRVEVSSSGRTATVNVTSYGDGCYRKGETVVNVNGLVAEIVPYDYTAPAGTACTRQLVSIQHTATVEFEQAGTATVRVRGVDVSRRSSANPSGEIITVERSIQLH